MLCCGCIDGSDDKKDNHAVTPHTHDEVENGQLDTSGGHGVPLATPPKLQLRNFMGNIPVIKMEVDTRDVYAVTHMRGRPTKNTYRRRAHTLHCCLADCLSGCCVTSPLDLVFKLSTASILIVVVCGGGCERRPVYTSLENKYLVKHKWRHERSSANRPLLQFDLNAGGTDRDAHGRAIEGACMLSHGNTRCFTVE